MGALQIMQTDEYNNNDEYLTIDEVAKKLKVTRFSVYNFMNQTDANKKLNFVYVGKRRRIKASELERYIRNNSN